MVFVLSEQRDRKGKKFFSPGNTPVKKGSKIPDPEKVSLDPLYDSTDKYRRVIKPIRFEDLFS
ncbi:MAG: hypothetical protein K8R46_06000 [Pirellulales bacterium]|nr:hypothetical protein [Pirellulales bacterium]